MTLRTERANKRGSSQPANMAVSGAHRAQCVLSASLRRESAELPRAVLSAAGPGRQESIDFVDRKSLGIEVVANPVTQFLEAFIVGIIDGLKKVVVSGDAAAVFGWTGDPGRPVQTGQVVLGSAGRSFSSTMLCSQPSPKS